MRIKWILLGGTLLSLFLAAVAAPNMTQSLQPGSKAPPFSLPGTDGKTHSLEEYRGKKAVVLAWFPKANTPGCTVECRTLGANAAALKKYDIALFAVSTDRPETNKAFAEKLGLTYPILSDPSTDTARAYGVLRGLPVAMRHTIYIGKDGKVLLVDTNVQPAKSAEQMMKNLDKLGIPKK